MRAQAVHERIPVFLSVEAIVECGVPIVGVANQERGSGQQAVFVEIVTGLLKTVQQLL